MHRRADPTKRFPTICVCWCLYCHGTHSGKLHQSLNCQNGPYNPHVAEAGTRSQAVLVGVLFDSEFVRQRLSLQLLHEDSICESNEKEQRPDGNVHKDGAAVLSTTTTHHPTEWHPHCCTTITITICGSTPSIVLFFLLLPLLLILLLPLPFLDDADDYIHPPDSEPYNNNNNNNNNSYSVVDKRPCRSNISKPIDTPSKLERDTPSQAQPASTFTDQDEDDFLSWAAAVVERLGSKRPMAAWQHECNP